MTGGFRAGANPMQPYVSLLGFTQPLTADRDQRLHSQAGVNCYHGEEEEGTQNNCR
jgi:hypothetical protein